jgi:endonuclease YncB( thermonuclease family)
VDLGFRLTLNVDVRLAHVNAPELIFGDVGGAGNEATQFVNSVLPAGCTVVLDARRNDKYARWLGIIHYKPGVVDPVEILASGINLNDELLRRGLAKPMLK